MNLKVFNTLSGKKEKFEPLKKGIVNFYVCGVTVYDFCHIGHARAYVVFDTIRRYLEYLGYKVNYVQNFTDIDDKIISKAKKLGIEIRILTQKYIDSYFEDMEKLNIKKAIKYPKATDYIQEMIDMTKSLITKGFAYESQGDVFFSVGKFPEYGKLSKKILDDLKSGIRVDISLAKKNPLDFVLWKKAKPEEPKWNSPWGKGRPGWHLECSVMCNKELGTTIDIHGGGEDLIFPHHENEIAQSESLSGKPLAKYWIHNGFVNINKEKMSKSLKNFLTIKEILHKYDGEIVRFFLLKVHYRAGLNFSFDALDEAKIAFERLKNTILDKNLNKPIPQNLIEKFEAKKQLFFQGMNDDFNFSMAISALFDLNKLINSYKCGSYFLKELGNIMGLFYNIDNLTIPAEIMKLISKRTLAKKNKDYQQADQIRDEILNLGYKIEDTPEGVKVKAI